jgi:hypothetical protein
MGVNIRKGVQFSHRIEVVVAQDGDWGDDFAAEFLP